ncbi:MAG: sigma-70 family RNA polymerase sigma factor [Brucella sp.]|uniref:sigma-70 family RNA polymerase sigma factor n=1 Tax=Brucella tritici TaxID=94626 RepID=UPI002E276FF0
MAEENFFAEQFNRKRSHLRGVAYRMLGSLPEAEDAVQETWLRLTRSDMLEVENLGGWLTTVLARVCLDMLRQRKARREESLDHDAPEPVMAIAGIDPDQEMAMADAVGLAMMVVLEKQGPAERIAYVLHDMFDISFDDIGTIVQRTPVSARQLASRTRRRVSVLWRICVAQNRLPRPSRAAPATPVPHSSIVPSVSWSRRRANCWSHWQSLSNRGGSSASKPSPIRNGSQR